MALRFRQMISGTGLTLNENGWTKRERIKVLLPPGGVLDDDVHYRAIIELGRRSSPPPINYLSPHPVLPGVYCTEMATEPCANSKLQVIVNIGWSDLSRVKASLDGAVVHETAEFAADGTPNTVLYLPTDPSNQKKRWPPGFYPEKSQKYCESSGLISVEVLRPGMVLEFERWRIAKTVTAKYKFIQGSTNSADWQNSRKLSWLCTGISPAATLEVSDKSGKLLGKNALWRERLTFQYRGFTAVLNSINNDWRKVIYYVDPRTGESPSDIDPKTDGFPKNLKGNGWRVIEPQTKEDFNDLNLPTIFA